MKILILEASTTSAKAMVFDSASGQSITRARAYGRSEDETKHDADLVAAAVLELGKELAAGHSIGAVAVTGAWHGVFLADRAVTPVTPVYLWSNTEPAELCHSLRRDSGFVREFYGATGCMVNATYPVFTLRMLAGGEGVPAGAFVMDEGSYLNWILTGQRVQTDCLASGSGMLNIHSRTWDKDSCELASVSESQLQRLVSPTAPMELSANGADLLGLPAGTPMFPASSDGGSNQVGVGAGENVMTFSVGTSGALRLSVPAPRLAAHQSTWCYLSPYSWLSGAATSGAGNCLAWFQERVLGARVSLRELDEIAVSSLEGPVFLPFIYGERCPGWEDRRGGALSGLRSHHSIGHVYQAVREGVLFNLLQCYESLTELNGTPDRIKLSGGVLHSASWTQMCADIFGVSLERDDVLHGSMLGGAVTAMVGLGELSSFEDYEPARAGSVEPDPVQTDFYRQRFQRYLEAYEAQLREL